MVTLIHFRTILVTLAILAFCPGLCLSSDTGTVWVWGDNIQRKPGDGTPIEILCPIQVKGLNNVIEVAIGSGYAIALKTDGTVWGWGRIDTGHWMKNISYGPIPIEVENNTIIKKVTSYFRPNKLINVIGITSSYYHSLALKNDGTIWCWGRCDAAWKWGDKIQKASRTPYQLEELNEITGFSDNGGNFILTKDGHVLVSAYGFKKVGQLKDVVKVADDIALKNDGTVWRFKYDFKRDIQKMIITASPINELNNIIDIASGYKHFLALDNNSSVWAWGQNNKGQLGDGTTVDKSHPVKVSGINNIKAISAGVGYSLALKSDGTVWAWGNNYGGRLGDGTETDRHIPVQVIGLKNVKKISAGLSMSLAIE